jgi:hypothetical protein
MVEAIMIAAHRSARVASQSGWPVQYREILARLAARPTGASGYAALQVPGYDVDTIDEAIGVLHHAGLLNAFFIARSARPRFHPSSLTPEGRRVFEGLGPL